MPEAALDNQAGEGGGAWYQLYIDPQDVDTEEDYNPGETKFFNLDGWQDGFPSVFDDLFEVVSLGGGIDEAPYYTAPGTPEKEVEVTFAIKFGQWYSDYSGTFYELLVDEIGLYHLESSVVKGGTFEADDANLWKIRTNVDGMPEFNWGYNDTAPRFGRDGCLHIYQDGLPGQTLIWQRLSFVAGETYRVTGALVALDYQGGDGGGAWYQLYLDPAKVIEGEEYNPGSIKFFNMDGWQDEFPEIFDGKWESEQLGAVSRKRPISRPRVNPVKSLKSPSAPNSANGNPIIPAPLTKCCWTSCTYSQ